MIKTYTLKTIFVVSLSVFFHFSLFSQVAVVGFADGYAHVDLDNLTSFPSSLQLDKLTNVIAADIGCENDGTLYTGKLPDFWQGTHPPDNIWNGSKNEWLESLANRAHMKGVNASISVGGDYFIEATGSTYINTFVGNIISFVNTHSFDGVNINWEYPSDTTEWNQCIALLDLLKDNLPSTKRLTIALSHATHVYDSFAFVPPQILSIVDGIYLMTYDEGDSAWPNHSNEARSINAINNWVNLVTPTCTQKRKLFLGSAFYGWHPVVGVQQGGQRVSYRDYILNNDTTWYSNPGDLPADVTNKAIHTRDNGFGGVFIWELGFDLPADDSQSLLKAIDDVMPSISGPNSVCNSNTTFTLYNPPPGSTVSWSHSSNLTFVLGGNDTLVVQAASSSTSGQGWVQATINGTCDSVQLPRHYVWVGTPMPSQPIVHYKPGYYSVCKRVSHTASTTQQSGVIDYQWQLIYPDGFTWPLSSGSSTTTFCIDDTGGPYKVGVKTKMDGCNWSEEVTKSFYVEDCGSGGDCGGSGGGLVPKLIVSPNPASYEITITEVERANDKTPWVLRLMSQQGTVMVSVSTTLPKTINLSGFHPGTYILHARRGQYLEKQVVIVE